MLREARGDFVLCSCICRKGNQQHTHTHILPSIQACHWLLFLRGLKQVGRWVAFCCAIFGYSYLSLVSGWSMGNAGESHPLPRLSFWKIDRDVFPYHRVGKDISTKCSCHPQTSGWELHLHVFDPSHKWSLDILNSTIDPPDFMSITFPRMFQSDWSAQGKVIFFRLYPPWTHWQY